MIGYHQQGDAFTVNGIVTQCLAASNFRVRIEGAVITARPSGKIRLSGVAIVCGDHVIVELPIAGDLSRGRIVYRLSGETPLPKPRHRRKLRGGKARVEFVEQMNGDSVG